MFRGCKTPRGLATRPRADKYSLWRQCQGLFRLLGPTTSNENLKSKLPTGTRHLGLAERTDDHLSLFEEGKEAEFFSGDEEMQDKIRFYLANDDARKRIAVAGRERCLRSGYSSAEQLANIIAKVNSQEEYRP